MKSITLVTLTLLRYIASRTVFNVHLDKNTFHIEVVDSKHLKVTGPDDWEIRNIVAYYTHDDLSATFCIDFDQYETLQFCLDNNSQFNDDMATFFGEKIDYTPISAHAEDYTIWDDNVYTHPTEEEFKKNIEKMVNKFIDYDESDRLLFLE
jgi:hypothetical protein